MMLQPQEALYRAVIGLILISGLFSMAGCDELQNELQLIMPSLPVAEGQPPPAKPDAPASGGAVIGAEDAVVTVQEVGPTWYVDTAGDDGDDGTIYAPWRTLAKAGQSAAPGDTVIVRSGTYHERFTPEVSGRADARITFRSQSRHGAAIVNGVDLSQVDYVRLEGFDITNEGQGYGVQVQAYYNSDHGRSVQVVGNYVHDAGDHAVWAANVSDLLVEGNEMYNNYHDGLIVTGARKNNQDVTIRGNYIHYNGQDGVHVEGFNILIENNRIGNQFHTDQHQDGIEVYGPVDGLIIRNNIVWDTTQNIYLSSYESYIRNVEVLGNIVYNQNNPNGGKGIFVVPDAAEMTNMRIEGNTFAYNELNMVTDGYADNGGCDLSGLTVRNNIFYMCDLSVSVNRPAPIDYNLYYNPGSHVLFAEGDYWTTIPQSMPHSLVADPLFVDGPGRDFRLSSGSPAINRGAAISGLTRDYYGAARPGGGQFDVGGCER